MIHELEGEVHESILSCLSFFLPLSKSFVLHSFNLSADLRLSEKP